MLRRAAQALGWFGVATLALVGSAVAHAPTPLFRRAVADTASEWLSRELAGEIAIGRIDRLEPGGVVLRHVVVHDARGRRVLVADRLEATPDVPALLRGEVTLRRVALRHGAVRLITEGDDPIPTIGTSFFPATPSPTPSSGPSPTVRLREILLEDVLAWGDVPGVRGLRAEHLSARGSLAFVRDTLALRLRDVHADVQHPYRPPLTLHEGYGLITNDPRRAVELHAEITSRPSAPREPDHARARVRVFTPEEAAPSSPSQVEVIVHAAHVSAELLSSLGVPGLDTLRLDAVRGWASLHGVPDDLRARASLDSAAGHVDAEARIRPGVSLDVDARTRALALDALVAGAPPLRLGGRGSVTVSLDPTGVADPTFRAVLEPFLYDTWAVPGMTVEGAIEPARVRIDRLDMPDAGGAVEGRGLVYFDGALDVDVRARVPQIARDPNVRRLMPGARASLDTALHATVTAGPEPHIDVRGYLDLGGLRLPYVSAERIRATGSLRGAPRQPEVDARVTTRGLIVADYALGDGAGTVRGGPTRYAVSASLREESRLVDFVGTITRAGDTWIIDAPQLALGARDASWRGSVEGLRITPGRAVDLGHVLLASGPQRLEARGRYGLDRLGRREVEADLQGLDVGAIAPFVPVLAKYQGLVDAHVSLQGDAARPSLSLEAAVREGVALGIEGIEGVCAVRYDVGAIEVDAEVTVGTHGTLALNVLGLVDSASDAPLEALRAGEYEAHLDVARLDLGFLHDVLAERAPDVRGTATGRVGFRGSLAAPRWDGTLRVAGLVFARQPAVDAAVAATWDGTRANVDLDVQLEGTPLANVRASTAIPFDAVLDGRFDPLGTLRTDPWWLTVRLPPRRLDRLPSPWSELVRDLPIRAEARLALSGGDGGKTRGTLDAAASWLGDPGPVSCGHGTSPRIVATANLVEGQVEANARAFVDRVELLAESAASFALPLDDWLALAATSPGSLAESVHWPTLDLRATFPGSELGELPYVCGSTTGVLTGSLMASGVFGPQPTARLVVDVGSLRVNDSAPSDAELVVNASTRAVVADLTLQYLSGDARAELQTTMESRWGPTDLVPVVDPDARFLLLADLKRANLAPLLAMVPGISNAEITADGTVQAQGTRDALTWAGTLELLDGRMELDGPGQRLEEVEGRLIFRENRADIQRFRARDVDGEIDARGQIDFVGVVPRHASLDVIARALPVRNEGIVLATLTGEANLDAEVTRKRTDARVRVTSLEVALPDEAAQDLQELDEHPDIVVRGETRAATEDPTLSYPFHIEVEAERPFWVRRSDFAAQVRARLDVLYRSPEMRVSGYVDLRRGFFEIFGKRFALQPGRMDFDGGESLDPTLDITAVYALNTANTRTITVNVGGRLSRPQIEFSSTESSDRGEIIALLVTGRSSVTSDVSGQSAQNLRAADEQATSFVTGVLGGILTLGLRNEFGEFLPTITLDTTDVGTRLRAGIQVDSFIRDNLGFLSGAIEGAYVEGFVEGGVATRGGFLLELQFPYNLVGRTTYTPPINFGLDFTWEP
jgi:autotransporter translocation and assembly factor TamB